MSEPDNSGRRRQHSSVEGEHKQCHYCGKKVKTTKDHIVPRMYIRHADVPQWVFQANLVPACYECNQKKKALRSDCNCIICLAAWAMLGPEGVDVPVVSVCQRVDTCSPEG